MKRATSQEIWDLVYRATRGVGFLHTVAEILADATTDAELYGKPNVGLNHLFYYYQAVNNGLINTEPTVEHQLVTDSMLIANANDGPMQVAYRKTEAALLEVARAPGLVVLVIRQGFAGGKLGSYARRLGQDEIVSSSTANSPAGMSVGGSYDRSLVTNPITCGVPLADDRAIVIEQAS